MVKNISEAQALIDWALTKGIKRLKLGELEVEFNPSLREVPLQLPAVDPVLGEPALASEEAQKQNNKEDEELLFWSSGS
jgi:ABC-type Fe3+ transport system substrate-binding protein